MSLPIGVVTPGNAANGLSRSPLDRRKTKERRGERRRQVDPTTCERDYNEEEIAFMKAMDQYKRDNRRPFPTWSEVLEVLRALGLSQGWRSRRLCRDMRIGLRATERIKSKSPTR